MQTKATFIVLTAWLTLSTAWASATRTIDGDLIKSSDHTKTFTPPAATDTLVGRASTDTLTNKSIDGSTNTLTKIPVGANLVQETPTGTVNGSNVTFTLANTPSAGTNVRLYQDGALLQQGGGNDYTISGATITMVTAPALGQSLLAVYDKY